LQEPNFSNNTQKPIYQQQQQQQQQQTPQKMQVIE